MKDKVIFRTWKDNGEVIALFPEIPSDRNGYYCTSYQHVGQHGGGSVALTMVHTKPSTAEEIAPLAAELTSIGYVLEPRLRETPKTRQTRMDNARSEL